MPYPFEAQDLLDWAAPGVGEGVDSSLLDDHIIPAAVTLVQDLTGRDFSVSASQATVMDGDDNRRVCGRYRHILLLPRARQPLTGINMIMEDGTTLTKASGFDTTVDVITDFPRFRLIRQNVTNRVGTTISRSWAPGVQNISFNLTGGPVDSDAVPKATRLLLMEVAWLLFKNPVDLTKASKSKPGSGATLQKALTPLSLRVFNGLMLHGEPSA